MADNANFTFDDVSVVSVAACEAPEIVTSDDIDQRLAGFYDSTTARPGLLRSLAGIEQRRQWPTGTSFMDAAAMAGRKAIEQAGVDPDSIGLLIDTSVCRERLEPSSAVTVHDQLGLSPTCINFDVVNACLGFLNGIHLAGTLIEAGQIDYALVVDGEGTREIHDNTIGRLLEPGRKVSDLLENFASLTLGSGSAAVLLGRHSDNPGSHKVVRGFFRTASDHHELCVGSLEQMQTDTKALLDAGIDLAKIAWDNAEKDDWHDMDLYVLHQVSRVHTNAMIDVLGLDDDRVPKTSGMYGNMGPAAIPFTLAMNTPELSAGDRVLCMGIGSGLNAAVVEILW